MNKIASIAYLAIAKNRDILLNVHTKVTNNTKITFHDTGQWTSEEYVGMKKYYVQHR